MRTKDGSCKGEAMGGTKLEFRSCPSAMIRLTVGGTKLEVRSCPSTTLRMAGLRLPPPSPLKGEMLVEG